MFKECRHTPQANLCYHRWITYTISAEGLKPSKAKVKAIEEAPAPRNVSELKFFLGLVNYYAKFLPNLASSLAPLYQLLNKTLSAHGQRDTMLRCIKIHITIGSF